MRGRPRAAHPRRGRGGHAGLAGGPDHPSLAEIAARLAEATGVRVHLTTVHRALRRAGWT
jgi:transposase